MPKILHNKPPEQAIFNVLKRRANETKAGKELQAAQFNLQVAVNGFFESQGKYPHIKRVDFPSVHRLIRKWHKDEPWKEHYDRDENLMKAIENYLHAYRESKNDPTIRAAYQAKRQLKNVKRLYNQAEPHSASRAAR